MRTQTRTCRSTPLNHRSTAQRHPFHTAPPTRRTAVPLQPCTTNPLLQYTRCATAPQRHNTPIPPNALHHSTAPLPHCTNAALHHCSTTVLLYYYISVGRLPTLGLRGSGAEGRAGGDSGSWISGVVQGCTGVP